MRSRGSASSRRRRSSPRRSPAMFLGDYGADVIKIEHPHARRPGARPRAEQGRRRALVQGARAEQAARHARPLEARRAPTSSCGWPSAPTSCSRTSARARSSAGALGWDELAAVEPAARARARERLRPDGPVRAAAPGFGTLAEAMSGFAALNGEPDGPPLLPPLALADGVAALATAFAILVALRAREQTGRGQVVDTSLVEPLLTLLGPQLTAYDLLGELQPRTGNRSSHNAPRNVYRTADGAWVAVSASATSIAERVLRLVGRPDLVEEPWFATGSGRAEHVDEIDEAVGGVDRRARPRTRCSPRSRQAEAAIAPIYDARDVLADPQLAALGSIATVEDRQLGPLRMPNVISRLSETPGRDPPRRRPPRRRHGRGASPSSASGRTSWRCLRARRRRMTVPPLTWLYVPADRPGPGREGDRLGGARGDRRPRGRRRARREGGRAREPRRAARRAAREAGLRPRQRRRPRATTSRPSPALAVAGILVPKVDGRPEDVPALPGAAASHCLIESAAGLEAAYAIASDAGCRGHLARRGRPPLGDRRARGRARLGARPDRQRRRRRRPAAAAAVGLPARPRRRRARRARARRGRELGHLGRAAIHPEQLPVIEQAYLPTARGGRSGPARRVGAARSRRRRHARRRRVRRRRRCSARPGRPSPWPIRTEPRHIEQGGIHEEPAHTGPRRLRRAPARTARTVGRRLQRSRRGREPDRGELPVRHAAASRSPTTSTCPRATRRRASPIPSCISCTGAATRRAPGRR